MGASDFALQDAQTFISSGCSILLGGVCLLKMSGLIGVQWLRASAQLDKRWT